MTAERARLGLLDTSVVIAAELGRTIRAESLPRRGAISIVTIAELRAGILAAPDIASRDRRLNTLERISKMAVLPIEDAIARTWAGMRAHLAALGKQLTSNDSWIAATAATYEIPVVTQDRDFYALSGVNGLAVVEV
jgi:predicted nucleic acid-binding protein